MVKVVALLTWHVTHHAAVKSTKTGCPFARCAATAVADQGCQLAGLALDDGALAKSAVALPLWTIGLLSSHVARMNITMPTPRVTMRVVRVATCAHAQMSHATDNSQSIKADALLMLVC